LQQGLTSLWLCLRLLSFWESERLGSLPAKMCASHLRLAAAIMFCFAVGSYAFLFRGGVGPKVRSASARRALALSLPRRQVVCAPLMAAGAGETPQATTEDEVASQV
ncbi:unnamed protein product, partial [Discosporangium mesarthrocarpum]